MPTRRTAHGKSRFFFQVKPISMICVMLFAGMACFAQAWYPSPKPIPCDQLPQLLYHFKKSKPDTNRVHLMLDIANAYGNKVFKTAKDLDTCMHYLDAARELSTKLDYRWGLNNALLFVGDILTALDSMTAAEKMLRELQGDTARIDLLLNLSFRYQNRLDDDKENDRKLAIAYAEEARDLSIKHHLRERKIMSLLYIARTHLGQGNPNTENELLDVIRQYQSIGYPYLHYTYYELCNVNIGTGKSDRALFYAREALKAMENSHDTAAAADIYALNAALSTNNDEYETGLDLAYKAMASYMILPGQLPVSQVSAIIPRTLRKLLRYDEAIAFLLKMRKDFPPKNYVEELTYTLTMGHIYRDKKEFQLAEKYFMMAFNLKKKNGILGSWAYKDLAQVYVEWGQYAKAKTYLNKVLEYPPGSPNSGGTRHLSYMLFLADSATGNYLSAIRHQNDFVRIDEYNLKQARDKEVQKLNVQYETEKKLAEIKIKDQNIKLLEQHAGLQQSQLRQAMQLRNFTIGGIIMLLIITGLLYKQYRQKQKSLEVITEANKVIDQKNETLEHLVTEKEWLLKEVHHRVKNNLHTVICLLESQAAYLKNEALTAIQDSQHRIYAMSLIHQKLYQSDVKEIDMNIYLPQLMQYLEDNFGASHRIRFISDIGAVTLSASQAIPIALIVNEAVTNSIKYAFPNNRKGEISVSLYKADDRVIELELADNGIGMDPEIINRESNSVGIELIKGLSKEIHAHLEFQTDNGTRILVTFMHDALLGNNNYYMTPMEEKEVFS